ncbi:helix-turn-helix domain-containing protein [Haloparvum sedimenti]|uniref:helix-turn-helix domain-containing protein n=1 Tax=Haloparvum sedimenti TaxID=1678448 RepID=UPI00071E6C77|nr:multiprotein-bridging factor 1 family protein [Haloparvum sedimenti]
MTKYSTGSGGGAGDGDACELCGAETGNLRKANVAGAELLVCSSCSPHDDSARSRGGSGGSSGGASSPGGSSGGSAESRDEESRAKRAARKQAEVYDAGRGDSSHWEEEGTNYEKDRLPYLVSGYGDVAEEARQDAGLTVEELAAELGVEEDDVLAVEQGRAARANVGGSVVRAIEERLGADLIDE